jgi:hypothetical protein
MSQMNGELTNIAALVERLIHKMHAESHEWIPVLVGLAILTLLFRRHWRIIVALFLPLFVVDFLNSFYIHFLEGRFPINPEYPPVIAAGFSFLLLLFWARRPPSTPPQTDPHTLEPVTATSLPDSDP